LRVSGLELDPGNMTELEKDTLLDVKWWSAEAIRRAAGREPFSVPRLDELLDAINAGKIPEEPVTIG
jgi:hypothetical protein